MNIIKSFYGRRFGLGTGGALVLNEGAAQRIIRVANTVAVTAATVAITRDLHSGTTVSLNRAAGVVATLPAATGSGDEYEFVVGTTVSSNNDIIKVANASDTMVGFVQFGHHDNGAGTHEAAGGTDDTITMNGTTTGGIVGSHVKVRDIALNLWLINGHLVGSGTLATPLSATV